MNPSHPQVDDAESIVRERSRTTADLREAKSLVPIWQQAIERNANAVITAIQGGFVSTATLARLRKALDEAPLPLLDWEEINGD